MKTDFKTFERIARVMVYFKEEMSEEEIRQTLQDWYVIFKETSPDDYPGNWLQEHLAGVTRDSHPYYIDPRGVAFIYRNPAFTV